MTVANVSARAKYSFFSFLFDPKIEVTFGTLTINRTVGHLVSRTALIQPPDVTVDPPPIAVKEPRSLDASQIRGRLTIIGGDQFEDAGDVVVFHNQEGDGGAGKLVERRVPRLVQVGVRNGVPVYAADIDPDTGLPVPDDVYVSLEGAGLGIDDVAGQLSSDGVNRYYGVEIRGVEGLELRLSDDADQFTVNHTPAGMALHVWAGGGDDDVLVEGIGGDTTISGGDGDDDIRAGGVIDGIDNDGDSAIDETDELDLATILGRLTVDGRDELQESSTQVRDNDPDPLVGTYLTKDLIIVTVGSAIPLPGAAGKFYYQADFVPILVDPTPATAGTPIQVRSVVVDSGGVVVERLVQELGSLEQARQKLNASLVPLWFDKEGAEVTDSSITGVPVLVPTSATGAVGPVRDIYIDATFNKVFSALGPNLVTNGTFGQFVATNGTSGGWTTAEIAGGGGAQGGTFVLDSDAAAATEPTMFQQLTGLSPNVTYRVQFQFKNWGAPYGDNTADTLQVEVGTPVFDCANPGGRHDAVLRSQEVRRARERVDGQRELLLHRGERQPHAALHGRGRQRRRLPDRQRQRPGAARAQRRDGLRRRHGGLRRPRRAPDADRHEQAVGDPDQPHRAARLQPRARLDHERGDRQRPPVRRRDAAAERARQRRLRRQRPEQRRGRRLDERERRRGRRLEGRRDVRVELQRLAVDRSDDEPGADRPRRRSALPRQRQLPQLRRRLRRRHGRDVRRLHRYDADLLGEEDRRAGERAVQALRGRVCRDGLDPGADPQGRDRR